MGQEWFKILKDGNTAFEEKQYYLASTYYNQVLKESRKSLRQLNNVVSEDSINILFEFCSCTRFAANASRKNRQWSQAEAVYLDANKALAPFISNLNNRIIYRAFALTEFKKIFYDLLDLYASNQQKDKLETYVKVYQPLLMSWIKELMMVGKAGIEMN